MSEVSAAPRRILHLVIEGFSTAELSEIAQSLANATEAVEIFPLTEANSREALEKIFTADTVAVWGSI